MVDVSVVVPVLNGAGFIRRNLEIVADELDAAGLDYEIIVVSDGSIDDTFAEASAASAKTVRVLHYDRNLGKGHAVRTGLVASRGSYVGFIDADLDLHPAALPAFLTAMRAHALDAAIGSKRHPLSQVSYSRRRRFYSWLYQMLVWALFRLNVRDTQVGVKLFRRELVDAVAPHLLVKRFAFDLELLAVARDFGFERVEELPIRMDHGSHTSGIRLVPIAHAIWDTLAVFYRLRILRYYRRRRALALPAAASSPGQTVLVAVVDDRAPAPGALQRTLDALERLEVPPARVLVDVAGSTGDRGGSVYERRARSVGEAAEDLVAFLRPGSTPVTNWLARLQPLMSSPAVAAAGGPVISAQDDTVRTGVSSALHESLFAVGRVSRLRVPGNLRVNQAQELENLLVRRTAVASALAEGARSDGELMRAVARTGLVVGVPDAIVVRPLPTLVLPFLRHVTLGVDSGAYRTSSRDGTGPWAFGLVALALAASGRARRGAAIAYAFTLGTASAVAALKHRSPTVGLAFAAAAPVVHLGRAAGAVKSATRARRGRARARTAPVLASDGPRGTRGSTSDRGRAA